MENQTFITPEKPQGFAGSKKIIYIVATALVVVAVIAGFSAYKHNQEVNSMIQHVVDELEDSANNGRLGNKIEYPLRSDKGSLEFRAGGYFDQVKDNKKLALAIVELMQADCTTTKKDEGEVFYPSGIGRVYRQAAVLEYLGYQNETVKACADELTSQALASIDPTEGWSTANSIYRSLLPYQSLTYYTGSQQLKPADVEAAYYARWQKLRQEMDSGVADLPQFIKDLYQTASVQPITIPQAITSESGSGSETSTAVNGVFIPEPSLDIDKMLPFAELKAVLAEYGEPAVFKNGQGGYYDGNSVSGTVYGDFRVQRVSGKARRTGKEDEFTEQYLREHYDHPDSIYYYFKNETINSLPTFFSDTREVFVYNKQVYAISDYAVYLKDTMLPYDYEAAKEAEFKHVEISQIDMQTAELNRIIPGYLRSFKPLAPTYQYDVENNLVTIYMLALPGTTQALLEAEGAIGEALLPFGEDTQIKWNNLCQYLTNLSQNLTDDLYFSSPHTIGVGVILISDVNPDAGLLSVLNGEVVQDNSTNPPQPAQTQPESPDTEAPESDN